MFKIYKYRTCAKAVVTAIWLKNKKRPETFMAYGDADEQIQWIDIDISIVPISVKKYRNILVSVVLLLFTSHHKAKKPPVCHSETLNSIWTGNVTKSFIFSSTNKSIPVPKNTELYSSISVVTDSCSPGRLKMY